MMNLQLKNYSLLTKAQHKELLLLRNSKPIRENSLSQEIIELEDHLNWVQIFQKDKDKKYFAVIYNKKIIGGVNIFDISKDAKWGIFFDATSPLTIKSIIPLYFIDYIFKNLNVTTLFAEIQKNNVNALSYNKTLGFTVANLGETVTLRLTLLEYEKSKSMFLLKKIIKKMSLYDITMEGI